MRREQPSAHIQVARCCPALVALVQSQAQLECQWLQKAALQAPASQPVFFGGAGEWEGLRHLPLAVSPLGLAQWAAERLDFWKPGLLAPLKFCPLLQPQI